VYVEHPALLHAATFHRYGVPTLRLAVYDVFDVVVLTSSTLVFRFRAATEYDVAPLDALQLNVTFVLPITGPGLLVEPGVGFRGVAGIETGVGV
jgi:hypothetical protein